MKTGKIITLTILGIALISWNCFADEAQWGPLIQTHWHQDYPFNKYCPLNPFTNDRSLAGCTATAMAQIVNYWKYPSSLSFDQNDSYLYPVLSGILWPALVAVDEDHVKYNFATFGDLNSHLNQIDFNNETDLAYLSFAVGVSMGMGYASNNGISVAFNSSTPYLKKFNYGSAKYRSNYPFPDSGFFKNMQENIKQGLPVPISVISMSQWPNTYAHTLIVDGYRTSGEYHLNIGWGKPGVFKSMDGGGNWLDSSNNLISANINCLSVDPVTPSTIYAGTPEGVYKTLNSGGSWSGASSGLGNNKINILVIDPITSNTIYVGTAGGIFKSTNAGGSWIPASNGLTNIYINSLAINPTMPSTIYAGTGAGVFKSTDAGGSWSPANNGLANTNITSLVINPTIPSTIYAGTGAGVFKSTDAGGSWSSASNGLTKPYTNSLAINPTMPSTIYAGTGAGVFKSTDAGGSWSNITSTALTYKNILSLAIDPLTASNVYVGTYGAKLDGWYLLPEGLQNIGDAKWDTIFDGIFDIYPYQGWNQVGADERNSYRTPYAGPKEAKAKWQISTSSEYRFSGLVVGWGNKIYTSCNPRNVGGSYHPSVWIISQYGVKENQIELNDENGEISHPAQNSRREIFVATDSGRIYKISHEPILGQPVISPIFSESTGNAFHNVIKIDQNDLLYASTFNTLYCLDSNGNKLWGFEPGGNKQIYRGVPAIDSARNKVYVSYYDAVEKKSYLGCVNRLNGELISEKEWSNIAVLSHSAGVPSVGDNGNVYIGCHNTLYALNPDNISSAPIWTRNLSPSLVTLNTPVIGYNGTIYLSYWKDQLTMAFGALDPINGNIKWEYLRNSVGPADNYGQAYATRNGIVCGTFLKSGIGPDSFESFGFEDLGDTYSNLWSVSYGSSGGEIAFGPGATIYTIPTTGYGNTISAITEGKVGNPDGAAMGFTNNLPPSKPFNPNPSDGARDQNKSVTLSWSCSDPETQLLKYDVFIATPSSSVMVPIATGVTGESYTVNGLNTGTSYLWKVIATDGQAKTEGETWSFTTAPAPAAPSSIIFQDDFENYTIGIPPPSPWSRLVYQGSITNETSHSGVKSLKLGGGSGASQSAFYDLGENYPDKLGYEAWVRVDYAQSGGYVGFLHQIGGGAYRFNSVFFNGFDGKVYFESGDSNYPISVKLLDSFALGAWHKVHVEIDFTSLTADIYINDIAAGIGVPASPRNAFLSINGTPYYFQLRKIGMIHYFGQPFYYDDFLVFTALVGDFDGDGDVDGSDLAALIANAALLDITTFAENFGKTDY